MNGILLEMSRWLWDYYLHGTILLAIVLLATWLIRQPARRMAIHWSVSLALVVVALLCAVPGWSLIHLFSAPPEPAPVWEPVAEPMLGPAIQQVPMELIPQAVEMPPAPPADEPELVQPEVAPAESLLVVDPAVLSLHVLLAGSAALLLWLTVGRWKLRQLRREAEPAPAALQQALSALVSSGNAPQLTVSEKLHVAVAVGLRHPQIILPKQLVQASASTSLQTVLAHELAHIRHRDLWLLALLRGLMLLLWAHPLYWLWRRGVRLDQETLADAAAADLSTRDSYAEQLVDWARRAAELPTPRIAASVGLWESPSQLKRRVAVLLDKKLTLLRTCTRRWRVGATALIAGLAVTLSLITLQPDTETMAEEIAESTADPSSEIEQENEGAEPTNFVRIVVDSKDNMTFEGKPTTWARLPALLKTIPNREQTVLEFAIDSEDVTIGRLNELKALSAILADVHGFKYSSDIGVHPLGSKGTKSKPAHISSGAAFQYGGKVEVVAIGTHREEQRWWDSSGKLLREVPFTWKEGRGYAAVNSDGLGRRVVIRVTGMPENPRLGWDVLGASSSTSATVEYPADSQAGQHWTKSFYISDQLQTFGVRIRVGAGPWNTVHKITGAGPHSGPNGKSVISSEIRENSGTAYVTISHTYNDQDYRMFAIDKNGKEHIQSGWGGTSSGVVTQSTASFPGLGRNDIRHLEFRVRDYEYVEIKDLPVHATSEARTEPATRDGSVKYRFNSQEDIIGIFRTSKAFTKIFEKNHDENNWVPENLRIQGHYAFDVRTVLDDLRPAFDEKAGYAGALDNMIDGLKKDPLGPKIDLQSDFLDHLAGQATVVIGKEESGDEIPGAWLVALDAKNPRLLSETFDKVMRNDPDHRSVKLWRREVWVNNRPELTDTLCFAYGKLFLGNDQKLLEQVLRHNAPKDSIVLQAVDSGRKRDAKAEQLALLKQIVRQKEINFERLQTLYQNNLASGLQLQEAEAELARAQVDLKEAAGKTEEVIEHYQQLVERAELNRERIAKLVEEDLAPQIELQEAEEEIAQARLDFLQAVEEKRAIVNRPSPEQIALLRQIVRFKRTNHELQRKLFEGGEASVVDVQNAQTSLSRAILALANATGQKDEALRQHREILKLAESDLQRVRALVAEGEVASVSIQAAEATVAQARLALLQAEDRIRDGGRTAEANDDQIAQLQDLVVSQEEIYQKVRALNQSGAAGGDARSVALAGYHLEVARAELATALNDRAQRLEHLQSAVRFAEENVSATQVAHDAGRVESKALLEAMALRTKAKLELIKARPDKRQAKDPPIHEETGAEVSAEPEAGFVDSSDGQLGGTSDSSFRVAPGVGLRVNNSDSGRETATAASALLKSNTLRVRLYDKQGRPVTDATVDVYDGNSFWAGTPTKFEQKSARTNKSGQAVFSGILDHIPADSSYRVEVQRTKDARWQERYVYVYQGKQLGADPLIRVNKLDRGSVDVSFSLRESCGLEFQVSVSKTEKRIDSAQILFRDGRVSNWTQCSLQDSDGQRDFTTIVPEMSTARFLATREGYYPREFKLSEELSPDRLVRQRIELEPAPLIELTVLTPDGKPAVGAQLKYLGPKSRFAYREVKPADSAGKILFKYPELGELARFRITHTQGAAEFRATNLPEPSWEASETPEISTLTDGTVWALIRRRIVLVEGSELLERVIEKTESGSEKGTIEASGATSSADTKTNLTFEDLNFDVAPGEVLSEVSIPERIKKLVGKQVGIAGYMYPTRKKRGITSFMLIRDIQEEFSRQPLFDSIVVTMKEGQTIDYTLRPVRVTGTFSLGEMSTGEGRDKRTTYFAIDAHEVTQHRSTSKSTSSTTNTSEEGELNWDDVSRAIDQGLAEEERPLSLDVDPDFVAKAILVEASADDTFVITSQDAAEGTVSDAKDSEKDEAAGTVTGSVVLTLNDSLPWGSRGAGPFSFGQESRQPNTIRGKCLGFNGKPAEGVQVSIYRFVLGEAPSLLKSTSSDSQGKFSLTGILSANELSDKATRLSADNPGAPTYLVTFQQPSSISRLFSGWANFIAEGVNVTYTLQRSETLSGQVTNSDGEPVVGAIVSANREAHLPAIVGVQSARTDDQGRYEIVDAVPFDKESYAKAKENAGQWMTYTFADGPYQSGAREASLDPLLQVSHLQYAAKKMHYEAIPGKQDVQLSLPALIKGRILGLDGKPKGGLRVRAISSVALENRGEVNPDAAHSAYAVTDDSGAYRFANLPAGAYEIGVVNPERHQATPQWMCAGVSNFKSVPGQENVVPDMTLQKGSTLRIRLVDASTNEPIDFKEGDVANVLLEHLGTARSQRFRSIQADCGAGEFISLPVLPGKLNVRVPHAGSQYDDQGNQPEWGLVSRVPSPVEMEIPAGKTIEIDIALPNRQPLVAARIAVQKAFESTDEEIQAAALQKLEEVLSQGAAEEYELRNLRQVRAQLLWRMERYAEMLTAYEQMAEMYAPEGQSYRIAMAMHLTTCPDESLRDYERAIEIASKVVAKKEQAEFDQWTRINALETIIRAYRGLKKPAEEQRARQQLVELLTEKLEANPKSGDALQWRAKRIYNWTEMGKFERALREYDELLKSFASGNYPVPPQSQAITLNNLAHLLSSCPVDGLRDGKRAVELAEQAATLFGKPQADLLDTLAAAYAETGNFEKAVATQQQALELARPEQREEMRQHLELYQQRKPLRMENVEETESP